MVFTFTVSSLVAHSAAIPDKVDPNTIAIVIPGTPLIGVYSPFEHELAASIDENPQVFEDFLQDLEATSEDVWGDIYALLNTPSYRISLLNG